MINVLSMKIGAAGQNDRADKKTSGKSIGGYVA
jgi:hypothetical protein